MPRKMTRPEVAKRLAIRAFHDARPATTHAHLVTLFGTSCRVATDALRRTAAQWAGLLVAAPVPRKHAATTRPTPPLPAPGTPAPPSRPGSRVRAVLVPPDPGPDIEKADPDVDVPEPADPRDSMEDPQPRAKRIFNDQ